jgi:hypothetical protein
MFPGVLTDFLVPGNISKRFHARGLLIALMMEAERSSESLVNFYQTTRRYNPEDSHLRTNRCDNLKSYKLSTVKYSMAPVSLVSVQYINKYRPVKNFGMFFDGPAFYSLSSVIFDLAYIYYYYYCYYYYKIKN